MHLILSTIESDLRYHKNINEGKAKGKSIYDVRKKVENPDLPHPQLSDIGLATHPV